MSNKTYESHCYIYTITDDCLEIKYNTSGNDWFFVLLISLFSFGPFCIALPWLIDFGMIMITAILICCFFVFVFLAIWGRISYIEGKKRNSRIKLIMDSKGIIYTEPEFNVFIPWSKVESFGISNNHTTPLKRRRGTPTQVCMHFATYNISKQELDRRGRIFISDMAIASKNVILFGFQEIRIDREIHEAILQFIYRYCDKSKEHNFISPQKW